MVRNSRNRTFQKNAILETFCALFWPPFLEALFFDLVLFWLVAEMSTRWTHAKRYKTRGFRPISRLSCSSTPLVLIKASILRTKFDDHFFLRVTIFYFLKFDFLTKLYFEVQKRIGAAEPRSFSKAFFCVVSGALANLTHGERARATIFCRVWRRSQNGLAAAVRRVFASFSVFSGDPFSQTSSGAFHTLFFLFRCFSLLFAFFLGLGATPHCTCVFGQLAFNLLIFLGFFWVFLQKHCFSP